MNKRESLRRWGVDFVEQYFQGAMVPHSMMVFVEGDKILQRDEKKGSGGGVRGEEGTLIERPRDKGPRLDGCVTAVTALKTSGSGRSGGRGVEKSPTSSSFGWLQYQPRGWDFRRQLRLSLYLRSCLAVLIVQSRTRNHDGLYHRRIGRSLFFCCAADIE